MRGTHFAIFDHPQTKYLARTYLVLLKLTLSCFQRQGFSLVDDQVTARTGRFNKINYLIRLIGNSHQAFPPTRISSTLRVAYGTSKAAVIHLTKQQAVELGEFGIRSNCVAPGPVRTKLAMAVHTKEIVEAYHDAIPLNRYGSEEEIANAIAFLASDKARFITGQLLSADGGFESAGVGLPALRSD